MAKLFQIRTLLIPKRKNDNRYSLSLLFWKVKKIYTQQDYWHPLEDFEGWSQLIHSLYHWPVRPTENMNRTKVNQQCPYKKKRATFVKLAFTIFLKQMNRLLNR